MSTVVRVVEQSHSALWPVLAGGGVGVFGTLLGTAVNDRLAQKREQRAAKARQRRAMNAIVGELLDAVSIIDKALGRLHWWAPGDDPRDLAWQTYNDDLAEFLSDDEWHRVRMTYEAVRSFSAQRNEPTRAARIWHSPQRRLRWDDRYSHVYAGAVDSYETIWRTLAMLRESYPELARPADLREMSFAPDGQEDPPEVRSKLQGGAYRPVGDSAPTGGGIGDGGV